MPKKFKVVIVDDNEDERFFMKEGFKATGLFEVVGDACNGEKMFELIGNDVNAMPEVVISDLNMFGKNGYDIITEMKNTPSLSHIPVVIVSNAPKRPYGDKCKALGAASFFTKPDTFLNYDSLAKTLYDTVMKQQQVAVC